MLHPLLQLPLTEQRPTESDFSLLYSPILRLEDNQIQAGALKLNKEYPLVSLYSRYLLDQEAVEKSQLSVSLKQIEVILTVERSGTTSLTSVGGSDVTISETDETYEVCATLTLDKQLHDFTFTINKVQLLQFGTLSLNTSVGDLTEPNYTVRPIAFIPVIKFEYIN